MTSLTACPVWGHRDPQIPAPVAGQTAQKSRDHQPLEAHRGEFADLLRQPALAVPQRRCAHEQDEMVPHQP